MNVFLEDQFRAAADEAALRAHRTADILGDGAPVQESEAGPFTTRLVADCLHRLDIHTQQSCRHLRSPGISWLLSWEPERLLCDRCAMTSVHRTLGPGRPQVCSICTHTVKDLGSVLVVAGPLMVMVAACAPCFTAEHEVTA
jgi:hypothetical protein